jgi:hypothetical protein
MLVLELDVTQELGTDELGTSRIPDQQDVGGDLPWLGLKVVDPSLIINWQI